MPLQQTLFSELVDQASIVNVASVPQRSPFRYPGGKTWLVPRLRHWIASQPTRPCVFIEPFAGGGILSLTVAFERLARQVIMVERDPAVAAVWKTMLGEGASRLADRIINFSMSPEDIDAALNQGDGSLCDRAFQTILQNRINHGGCLAAGTGRLKYGEGGKGVLSRWYPATLQRRILDIATVKECITFIEGDAFDVIRQHSHREDAIWLIDPPYTAAGKRAGTRLYTHSQIDHDELFRLMENVSGDFLMTYDNAEGVQAMADQHGFDTQRIAMKNTHHAEMNELLIGLDLAWARGQ